jgi:hypothetical protein
VLRQSPRGIDFVDDLARMRQDAVTEVGHRKFARRPQQQALTKLRLQGRQTTRHGRLRQAQTLAGTAETAFVDDAGEEQQIVRLESHTRLVSSIKGTMLSIQTSSGSISG